MFYVAEGSHFFGELSFQGSLSFPGSAVITTEPSEANALSWSLGGKTELLR